MERLLSSETKPELTLHPLVFLLEQKAHANVEKSLWFCIGRRGKLQEVNSGLQTLEDSDA
jgi:hypothetical protein